jgi:hypothetical protein
MDYFSRKSLSKYLMNTIDFNKHDVDIFINDTWQKYAGNIVVCFLQFDWLIFLPSCRFKKKDKKQGSR